MWQACVFSTMLQGSKVTNHCSGINIMATGLGSIIPRLEWMNFGNIFLFNIERVILFYNQRGVQHNIGPIYF